MKLAMNLWFIMLMGIFVSCGGGGGSDSPNAQCSQNRKNAFVYDLLNDSYLWYDQVEKGVDPAAYPSPEVLLESVIPDIDRWSYVTTSDAFYQYQEEGRYSGMGLAVEFDAHGNLWVRFVYDGSPADMAGITRTNRILRINSRAVSSFTDFDAVWDEVYRYDSADIEFMRLDGSTRTVTLEWDWVTINAVLHREVFDVGDTKVGYLVFKTFINPAMDALDAAFEDFRQQGIDELILDLRYNGGGRLSVALHLASLIAGENADGEVFKKIIHNDKYRQYDDDLLFTMPSNALGLNRVFVISTGNTCSASESIIIGLKPFVNVVQVGQTTCGKPVGMYAHEICDQVILPIEFKGANADDETDYFQGLDPACPAVDDLARAFGDQAEDALSTALYYMANDGCPVRARSAMASRTEQEKPDNTLKGFRRELGAL